MGDLSVAFHSKKLERALLAKQMRGANTSKAKRSFAIGRTPIAMDKFCKAELFKEVLLSVAEQHFYCNG
jgi:hypothetical protein